MSAGISSTGILPAPGHCAAAPAYRSDVCCAPSWALCQRSVTLVDRSVRDCSWKATYTRAAPGTEMGSVRNASGGYGWGESYTTAPGDEAASSHGIWRSVAGDACGMRSASTAPSLRGTSLIKRSAARAACAALSSTSSDASAGTFRIRK